MKKVLFTATVDSHILHFHLPYLKLFKEKGYEVHVATNGNEQIPYCDKKHIISFEKSPFKVKNIKAIMELRKIIDSQKFDIIHTHTPMGSVVTRIAARNARKNNKTKVIYTAHGFHFYKGAPLINWILYYPVEKILSKYTDTIITINIEDFELAKKKFSKRTNIEYVPGVGIDEKKFEVKLNENEKKSLKLNLGIENDDYVIIYPAEISKRKRQIWMIDSIKELLDKEKKIKILLPGKDLLSGECKEYVQKLGLENRVKLLGYRKDIPKLLKISNLAVSSAKQEGLPVNIMEAMYVGLPIIATNCRGNRDLVDDNKSGKLIDLNDKVKFREAIETIIKNDKNVQKYSDYNKRKIEGFLLNNIINKMSQIYNL